MAYYPYPSYCSNVYYQQQYYELPSCQYAYVEYHQNVQQRQQQLQSFGQCNVSFVNLLTC